MVASQDVYSCSFLLRVVLTPNRVPHQHVPMYLRTFRPRRTTLILFAAISTTIFVTFSPTFAVLTKNGPGRLRRPETSAPNIGCLSPPQTGEP